LQVAAFNLLNPFARVVMCGMVSQYNAPEFPPGPNLGFVVGKRVRIEGLIVFDNSGDGWPFVQTVEYGRGDCFSKRGNGAKRRKQEPVWRRRSRAPFS